jgi:hypothetical protein
MTDVTGEAVHRTLGGGFELEHDDSVFTAVFRW